MMADTARAPHRHLSRLDIPPPSPNDDQPVTLDGRPLFFTPPPVLFHPLAMAAPHHPNFNAPAFAFPPNVQAQFMPQHRPRPSLALNLNGPGMPMMNPAAIPLPATPGGPGGMPMHFNPQAYPFVPPPNGLPPMGMPLPSPLLARPNMHSRRTQSVSLGGPPKAVLGGPKRADQQAPATPVGTTSSFNFASASPSNSTSAVPVAPAAIAPNTPSFAPAPVSAPAPDAPKAKMRKCVVRLPVESAESDATALWTRHPIRTPADASDDLASGLDISTADIHPDLSRRLIPSNIEISLPVKESWDVYKKAVIEEKLAKLGVEPSIPQHPALPFIMGHHPHSRAASISSPADPALLHFKLSNLGGSGHSASQSVSQSSSPGSVFSDLQQQQPGGRRPPGHGHGHTISLAASPGPGSYFPGPGGMQQHMPGQFGAPSPTALGPPPRLSPFGSPDVSNLGPLSPGPFGLPMPNPLAMRRSPLPPSGLRSVSETEDEEESAEHAEDEDNEGQEIEIPASSTTIFAPQAKTPVQASMFNPFPSSDSASVSASESDAPSIPTREANPNFALNFSLEEEDLDEADDEYVEGEQPSFRSFDEQQARFNANADAHGSSTARVLDLDEFGGSHTTEQHADGEEEEEDDDGRTEGAFITPSHSRQVSRALSAALTQPAPPMRGHSFANGHGHRAGDSVQSVQSVFRVEDLRQPTAIAISHPSEAEPPHHAAESDREEELLTSPPRRSEREMSVITDDYAGGDEKENIPPPSSTLGPSSASTILAVPPPALPALSASTLHGDLGFVWPSSLEAGNAGEGERRVSAATDEWTNPSTHPPGEGDVLTGSEWEHDHDAGHAEGDEHEEEERSDLGEEGQFVDNESTGEWSNPSDEEREREARRERQRHRQRASETALHHAHGHSHQGPSASIGSAFGLKGARHHHSDDIISNPSEEDERTDEEAEEEGPSNYYSIEGPSSTLYASPHTHGSLMAGNAYSDGASSGRASRPLPLPPSAGASPVPGMQSFSRNESPAFSAGGTAGGHSRSGSFGGSGLGLGFGGAKERLNPHAKPFVFGASAVARAGSNGSGSPTPSALSFGHGTPGMVHQKMPAHSRQSSIKLNATAVEFKPSMLSTPPTNASAMPFGMPMPAPAPPAQMHLMSSTSFDFRPPPGVPSLAFPEPAAISVARSPRPLPHPPLAASTSMRPNIDNLIDEHASGARASQGREKRQRRLSSSGDVMGAISLGPNADPADDDETPLFQFPADWPQNTEELVAESRALDRMEFPPANKERETMPRRKSVLNPAAKPFTFGGHVSAPTTLVMSQLQLAGEQSSSAPATVPGSVRSKRSGDEMDDDDEDEEVATDYGDGAEKSFAPNRASTPIQPGLSPDLNKSASRRPPIPDFRHPVSTKTVPASVFKALSTMEIEGSSSVRPTVRSRLSSREQLFIESPGRPPLGVLHTRGSSGGRRGSLDDINLPAIARRATTAVTSGHGIAAATRSAPLQSRDDSSRSPFGSSVINDVFTQSPEANQLNLNLSMARLPSVQRQRPRRPSSSLGSSGSSVGGHHHDEEWKKDVHLDSNLMDILDERFDMLRKELSSRQGELSHEDLRHALSDFIPLLNTTFATAASELLASRHAANNGNDSYSDGRGDLDFEHLHSIIESSQHELRQSLQRDIAELAQELEHQTGPHSIAPLIRSLHGEVIGTLNAATSRLLGQLDAADDVARRRPSEERQKLLQELMHVLIPHLNSIKAEPFDIDRVTARVSEAVKPHISQLIDLASDKKETASMILDHLLPVLTRISTPQPRAMDEVAAQLGAEIRSATAHMDPHTLKEAVADLVVERLDARLANRDNLTEHLEELARRISDSMAPSLEHSEKLSAAQDGVSAKINDVLSRHTALQGEQSQFISTFSNLPAELSTASKALSEAQTELVAKARVLNEVQDLQEVVRAHVEVQMQLGQARATIPQLNAEKDILAKRVAELEALAEARKGEIDRLMVRVEAQDELVAQADARVQDVHKIKGDTDAKLQALEASSAEKDHQIESLQSDKHALQTDSKELQSKLADVQSQYQLSQKDLAAAEQGMVDLATQRDQLLAQQDHWTTIKQTSDQVAKLVDLLETRANSTSEELGKFRDRTNALEGELSAVNKTSAEQEKKIATLQKSAASSKATILNAQQRAAEWEKKANDRQNELEQSDKVAEGHAQALESATQETERLRAQLSQMEDSERDSSEREVQLKNQVSSLDSQLQAMKSELEKLKSEAVAAAYSSRAYPTPRSSMTLARRASRSPSISSGLRHSLRPSSDDEDEDDTKTERNSDHEEGTWSSMHAPTANGTSAKSKIAPIGNGRPSPPSRVPSTPRPAHATANLLKGMPVARRSFAPPATVSPTMSAVSLAPTQGDDGWWS